MKKRILIIDDERDVLSVVRRLMQKNGYKVYGCTTGVEATEFVGKYLPDLIIADFNLSELGNGVDLALSIRWSIERRIPVIIMSNSLHAREKARTNRFGFIEKPVNANELTLLVERSFTN